MFFAQKKRGILFLFLFGIYFLIFFHIWFCSISIWCLFYFYLFSFYLYIYFLVLYVFFTWGLKKSNNVGSDWVECNFPSVNASSCVKFYDLWRLRLLSLFVQVCKPASNIYMYIQKKKMKYIHVQQDDKIMHSLSWVHVPSVHLYDTKKYITPTV